MNPNLHKLAKAAAVLAFCVIVLGAWVRLSHAGLGCPDWPGCYGQLGWPAGSAEIESANQAFPERPVETSKAWREMLHRYIAGALMLLTLAINWSAWKSGTRWRQLRPLAAALLILIVFQALLGMWTVTLKLKPIIVMGHLLGGLTTFALILWIALRSKESRHSTSSTRVRNMAPWVVGGLLIISVQIALGGWTSANYAALVCPDLPTCMGQWLPETNFREGFVLWREVGVDYEGGVLDLPSRVAIQLSHRIGAVISLIAMIILALKLMRVAPLRHPAIMLMSIVSVQFVLGLLNVVWHLPLSNAVAHNGGAALLLATLVWLLHLTTVKPRL
jgi:cytochrome c oxidase assembly protein subunit 15